MSERIIPGAEPMSHEGARGVGVLALHGFTGNPSSMRLQAEALAAAGYHVELPRLPGHGTTMDDMMTTGWSDWTTEVEGAYQRLVARVDRVVVAGLSMGGSLTLWTALQHPDVAGIACINPLTLVPPDEVTDMVRGMVDEGSEVMPGIGSDIADPDAVELAYEGTPLRPLLSFLHDGVASITGRLGELKMPLLLITSHQDHVVEPANSEYLAADYGGEVDHVWLDRSFHVATQDYDRDAINEQLISFVAQVTADRA